LTDYQEQLEPGDQAGVRHLMASALPEDAGTEGNQVAADVQPAAAAQATGEDVVRFSLKA